MSDIIDKAVAALAEKLGGNTPDFSAKFVLGDEGAILLDGEGARSADAGAEADVTMTADADVFEQILDGSLNPTGAVMSGKLTIDGDMGLAMQLGQILS